MGEAALATTIEAGASCTHAAKDLASSHPEARLPTALPSRASRGHDQRRETS